MGRRIDVELTSSRDDGTWTWRAAGAKQPKGVLDAGLLYEGARVGDVVRAEADFEMEGINITLVLPPKEKRAEPARLEIIGPPREHQGVTSSLVPKSDRPRSPRRDSDRDGDRDGRRDRPSGAPRPRANRPPRTDGARPETRSRPARPAGDERPRAGRPERERRSARPERAARPPGSGRREPAPPPEPAPKPKKLSPANVHRAAVVQALPPEQQPIAEQVLRGGIPAVRQAIDVQNARLREEGQPEVHGGSLIAIAEQLLPQLKAADWRDRAEAAARIVDDVALRDLRSVVAGADLARDDEGRLLAGQLRQALERRLDEQRREWEADITGALDEGRLVRALRLSAHPSDAGFKLPAELAARLSETAGAAMSADASPDRWATLLEAVADSPVRRTVKPIALPAEPGDALLQAARQASGRVPALAAMLGISMPPPPGPTRTIRPAGRPHRGDRPRRRPPAPDDRAAAAPSAPAPPAGEATPPADASPASAEPAPLGDSAATPADTGPADAEPTPPADTAAVPPAGAEPAPDAPAPAIDGTPDPAGAIPEPEPATAAATDEH